MSNSRGLLLSVDATVSTHTCPATQRSTRTAQCSTLTAKLYCTSATVSTHACAATGGDCTAQLSTRTAKLLSTHAVQCTTERAAPHCTVTHCSTHRLQQVVHTRHDNQTTCTMLACQPAVAGKNSQVVSVAVFDNGVLVTDTLYCVRCTSGVVQEHNTAGLGMHCTLRAGHSKRGSAKAQHSR